MWKLVYGSVPGTSHIQSELPCQDYCAGTISGTTLIVACADGAGSAEFSQMGSRVVVDRFLEISSGDTVPTKEQVEAWIDAARERLLEVAEEKVATPRQFACTFLAALIGDGWTVFAQLGDGVMVFDGPNGYEFAFWPDNGEYANTTRFLSEVDYRQHLRIEIEMRNVSELAVLTDGLQMLALEIVDAKVHNPFFAPLFRALKNGPDQTVLQASLLEFLSSKRVNERTDDDKTLLLATRTIIDVPSELPDATA